VLAVSTDPADVQLEFARSLDLDFPLLPDTGRNLSVLYRAVRGSVGMAERQSVMIDKEGIVRFIDKDIHLRTHGSDVLARMREIGLAR